jgi:hypothetical protein
MRLRATHFVVPVYILAAVLYTWPTAREFSRSIPTSGTFVDAPFQAFLLGWDGQALARSPGHVFDPPIFYPEQNTLTYMDHLIGETVLASPFLLLFPSVAPAYNFLLLLSFVLSAWGAYRLARLLQVSRPAAFLAGFLYAFSFYRFANIDSLNQMQMQFFPIAIFFGIRFLRRGRTRDFLGVALTFLAQVYFGWYYTCYLACALVLLLAYGLLRHRASLARAHGFACAAIALATLALALPVTLPYLREARLLPEFHRSLGEVTQYSASGLDYFRINPNAILAKWLLFAVGPQSYWPGPVALLLAALGLVARLKHDLPRGARDAGYFFLLMVVAYVFSLGPYLHVAGHRVLPLPYGLLFRSVPLLSSMRAAGRLSTLVLLGLVIWAAIGYDFLRRRMPSRIAWLVPAIAFPLAVLTVWQLPLRMLELPTADRLPPVYAWLARQPDAFPILELPPGPEITNENERQVLRQFCVLYHRKPTLDGASGFVSQRYRRFRATMLRFPANEAIEAASGMGARLVIVHLGEYEAEGRETLLRQMEADPRFEPVAAFGMDRVYRLGGAGGG